MLDYAKLFEDSASEILFQNHVENDNSVLSSIKEERESKEEQFGSKKGINNKPNNNNKSLEVNSQDLNYELDESVSENGLEKQFSKTEKFEPKSPSKKSKHDPMTSGTDFERDPSKNPYEDEALNEQQILDIAEEVFVKISERIRDNFTLSDLYSKKLQTIKIDGEDTKILDPDDFIDSFKKLGVPFLEELEIE